MDELVRGVFERASVERLLAALDRLRAAGCDAVVLGCTELPLVVDDTNASLPTLDSTRLLARAALRWAIGWDAGGARGGGRHAGVQRGAPASDDEETR